MKTKTGVRQSTKQGYVTVQRLLAKETFGKKTIRSVKTSDAKLFLIKLQQEDGKSVNTGAQTAFGLYALGGVIGLVGVAMTGKRTRKKRLI